MQTTLSANVKGRHAELLAQTALLANGWEVLEPISPLAYDMAIKRDGSTHFVQVKTAFTRNEERYGGEYIIVRGAKNNGDVYGKDEVDYFIAVWQGDVYMFPNREVKEYWVKPAHIDERWTKLGCGI